MGQKVWVCNHCRRERIRDLKKSGILESIIIPFPSDLPNIGYARAMRGLVEMNDAEILKGCNEEASAIGEYFEQSCILRAYINTLVYPLTNETDRYIDAEQLSYIISNAQFSPDITFSAKLCRAQIHMKLCNFTEADRALDELESEYPDNGLIYIVRCGILTMHTIEYPKLFERLCRCCALLPDYCEAHFQKIMFEFRDDVPLLEVHLKHLIVKFPQELAPRKKLIHIYITQNEIKKAEILVNNVDRYIPDESNQLDYMRGHLEPMSLSSVESLKSAIRGHAMDGLAHQGLFNYYVFRSREYGKALEVANMAVTFNLEPGPRAEMFNARQALIAKIAEQNFWDKL